jgi:Flp pilus assembly pilin Flp
MQSITDHSRELAIRAKVAISDIAQAVQERAREQRGQTAAEYMGILVLIALVFVLLFGLNLDASIRDALSGAIDDINGEKNGAPTRD